MFVFAYLGQVYGSTGIAISGSARSRSCSVMMLESWFCCDREVREQVEEFYYDYDKGR